MGRFARGWRRLPGKIPGQPQTRLRARSSIATTPSRERTCRGEHDDLVDPRTRERVRARRRRRSRRQDVVHQDDAARHAGGTANRLERAAHGHPPLVTRTSRLGSGRHRSTREPEDRQAQPAAHGPRERPRLVVAAFGQPASCERHPGDRVGGRRTDGDHGVGERGRHAPPTRELQPMDRGARGPGVQERRPGDAHRRRRAVAAAFSTATGPGRPHRSHHGGPSASSAARHPSQNGQLPTPQPAHRGGNTTSSARASTTRR